jgi:hypothetical protein
VNEWLTRGMLSLAAGALSTAVIVKTADGATNAPKKGVKKKKSGKKKKNGKAPAAKQGDVRDTNSESGLDMETWWGQVKQQGSDLSEKVVGYARGDSSQTDLEMNEPEHERSGKDSLDRKGPKASQNGYSTLKEEAAYWAKSKVKEKVVESTGLDDVIAAAQTQTDKVRAQGDKLKEKISESEMGEWIDAVQQKGGDVAKGVRDAGNMIQEELSSESSDPNEWRKSVEKKVSAVGVWLEGPGAVRYVGEEPDVQPPAIAEEEADSPQTEYSEEAGKQPSKNETDGHTSRPPKQNTE